MGVAHAGWLLETGAGGLSRPGVAVSRAGGTGADDLWCRCFQVLKSRRAAAATSSLLRVTRGEHA